MALFLSASQLSIKRKKEQFRTELPTSWKKPREAQTEDLTMAPGWINH